MYGLEEKNNFVLLNRSIDRLASPINVFGLVIVSTVR